MSERLRFGDVVEWPNEGGTARWIIIAAAAPPHLRSYRAAWLGDDETYNGLGDVATIGIGIEDGVTVIRRGES